MSGRYPVGKGSESQDTADSASDASDKPNAGSPPRSSDFSDSDSESENSKKGNEGMEDPIPINMNVVKQRLASKHPNDVESTIILVEALAPNMPQHGRDRVQQIWTASPPPEDFKEVRLNAVDQNVPSNPDPDDVIVDEDTRPLLPNRDAFHRRRRNASHGGPSPGTPPPDDRGGDGSPPPPPDSGGSPPPPPPDGGGGEAPEGRDYIYFSRGYYNTVVKPALEKSGWVLAVIAAVGYVVTATLDAVKDFITLVVDGAVYVWRRLFG